MSVSKYTTVDFPPMGVTLIATEDIKEGEVIVVEKPFVYNSQLCPLPRPYQDPSIFLGKFKSLDNNVKEKVMKLYDPGVGDTFHPHKVVRIIQCHIRYFGLYEVISRINHSCDPTCQIIESNEEARIVAVRNINKNKHITINYLGYKNVDSAAVRQDKLYAGWKIVCCCPFCPIDELVCSQTNFANEHVKMCISKANKLLENHKVFKPEQVREYFIDFQVCLYLIETLAREFDYLKATFLVCLLFLFELSRSKAYRTSLPTAETSESLTSQIYDALNSSSETDSQFAKGVLATVSVATQNLNCKKAFA